MKPFFALFLAVVTAQHKVSLEIYSESLCPSCRTYLNSQVVAAVQSVGTIMDLTLLPYGNANETAGPAFKCEHGVPECMGNMIEACAMKYYPAPSDWIPFVACLESSNQEPAYAAPGCAAKSNWNNYDTDITNCVFNTEGSGLMHKIAVATQNLVPHFQWLPWVVLNGMPLTSPQLSSPLFKLVCNAYQGSKAPPACTH